MNEENQLLGSANDIYFQKVEGENTYEMTLEDDVRNRFVGLVESRFAAAENARDSDEHRWLKAYHNFRGIYGKHVKFRDSEKSKVFVKVTKTKVLAAYGQLIDVVFGTGKFPIGVAETNLPEGIPSVRHLDVQGAGIEAAAPEEVAATPEGKKPITPSDVGYAGDGRDEEQEEVSKAGETLAGGASYFEEQLKENEATFVDGASPNPQMLEINPAREAARKMETLIHDQIEESSGSSELRNSIFEAALFGTGVVKGPFNFNKTIGRWATDEETGERTYTPEQVRVPKIEFVSIWDFFPDPSATTIEECEYIVHRHKYNRSQLRALAKMPYFDKDAIRECLQMGGGYEEKDYENELKDDRHTEDYGSSQFEVLEYWGMMDVEYAKEIGLDLGEEADELEEIQVNAWVSNGKLLRGVANPFTPHRIPYNAFSYEKNPYSFFGVGVAENMDDSQQVMNGHARMAIDNLALSGSLVFDVDESALVGGQNMEIYPGKVFRRQAGQAGQSIYGMKFPNTSQENLMMFDKFRQLADEQTGIPSYSHGQTGVQSMTRTASGMSMLLGAASLNIKTVVKNLDDFLLKPLGEAFFQWNMQFFEGPLDIQGDLEVKAMGTNSLMQKEVRSQRLTMFLQTAQNPAVAPFVKISKIVSELAYSLDLDPDEILNDPEEAAIMAQIIGAQNAGQTNGGQAVAAGEQQGAMGGVQGAPEQPQDLGATGTGGGNIGTGAVPQAGESEFSG